MVDTHSPQAGIADALTQLSEETRQLVRQELDDARDEMWARAKCLLPGLALGTVGAGLALATTASVYRVTLRGLERVLGPTLGAMVATVAFGSAAAVTSAAAWQELRDAPLPAPLDTAARAARDVGEVARDLG